MTIQFRNPDSELNIKRIDAIPNSRGHGETHGFQVHARRGEVTYTRFYSDLTSGGKESAREKARKFRVELLASIPPSKTGQPFYTSFKNNKSGHIGISIDNEYVQATVRIARGVSKNKKFRIGDKPLNEVLEEALKWRLDLLQCRIETEQQTKPVNTIQD